MTAPKTQNGMEALRAEFESMMDINPEFRNGDGYFDFHDNKAWAIAKWAYAAAQPKPDQIVYGIEIRTKGADEWHAMAALTGGKDLAEMTISNLNAFDRDSEYRLVEYVRVTPPSPPEQK